MTRTLPGAESAFDAIQRVTEAGLPAQELIEEVMKRIDRVVPSDGYFVGATDPETTLSLGAGIVHDLPYDACQPTWDHEFLVPDYLKFADILESGRPVADLHDATGGRPERSPRQRAVNAPIGLGSEVRAVFAADGSAWGIGQFNRFSDSPRYSEDEKAWLERVAPLFGAALRQALLTEPAELPADRGPGIVVLDADGSAVSATSEATAWFEEIDPTMSAMPFEATAYAARVRASADGESEKTTLRARLRTRNGVWLSMHAAMLEGTDQLALVIGPAKASEVAPLIVEAYGFTQRELEVTRAIARGLGTAEIAAHLFVSQHTVRDHVKSVFEKVGVSSRGELVAKVFADNYSTVQKHADD
ncbi:MAG: LuxR C-terminal-related transcriptional regulator [Thermoleophilaceae bacterium]